MIRRPRPPRRRQRPAHVVLNIVSLIDIFAILVFYLLVDSLVMAPPLPEGLRLPAAKAEPATGPGITIVVSTTQVLIDGRAVQDTSRLGAGDSAALRAALARAPRGADGQRAAISVLADRRIPYRVLREVMNACAAGDSAEVSLAVVEDLRGGGA